MEFQISKTINFNSYSNNKFKENIKMLIISGCPRSGTSVQMDIHRAVFGEERILGAKFPQEKRSRDKED